MIESITYPLTIVNGSLKFSKDSRVITERIFSVLETRPYERIENPTYGTPSYIFSSVPSSFLIVSRIEVSLLEQIPELKNLKIDGEIDNKGILNLAIQFNYDNELTNLNLALTL